MFNLGPWEIIAILLVVVLIFGGKKLRSLGSDIGAGIKGCLLYTSDAADE